MGWEAMGWIEGNEEGNDVFQLQPQSKLLHKMAKGGSDARLGSSPAADRDRGPKREREMSATSHTHTHTHTPNPHTHSGTQKQCQKFLHKRLDLTFIPSWLSMLPSQRLCLGMHEPKPPTHRLFPYFCPKLYATLFVGTKPPLPLRRTTHNPPLCSCVCVCVLASSTLA